VKFVRKVLARNRIKAARQSLSQNPSPHTYAALAKEYAMLGLNRQVRRVCEEGLVAFPANNVLVRIAERSRRLDREKRMVELKQELSEAPRPALWREMCEILLESGQLARAEEMANQWIAFQKDGESRFMLARIRARRFLADRGRELGLETAQALDDALKHLPSDPRIWHLKLDFTMKIGAWSEAKRCAARLLQLEPGTPELEGRYRTLDALAEGAPTIERALIQVERTGRFADDESDATRNQGTVQSRGGNVRPILRELAGEPDIHAAMYLRGSTILMQGPKGATAERTARAVRGILSSGRSTARRLGLGQTMQIQLEGDFGILSIAPGEMDAGAIWSRSTLGREREEMLLGLAGLNADLSDGEDDA